MLRVLSMIATSLAIAPATATWGSATMTSEAFMSLNLLRTGWGSSVRGQRHECRAGRLIAVLRIPAHPLDLQGRVPLHPGPNVGERRPLRLRAPEREPGRGVRGHQGPHRLV